MRVLVLVLAAVWRRFHTDDMLLGVGGAAQRQPRCHATAASECNICFVSNPAGPGCPGHDAGTASADGG